MKKIELLSPVGNMEMFYQAVHHGADAVYLAGEKYGARRFAKNFTPEELKEVFSYARLYGVKVYVTINTLIYEHEIEDFIQYVEFLYRNGVDAVIMQDVGMMWLVHQMFPNLEIHASTQCHNHDRETVEFFKKLGVTRVVLAREMSLEEIKNIDVDIEKEVFVYGALCVSYSGCCLFSSMNGGRSGNRGECVGSCRLPYRLIRDGKRVPLKDEYLLSTKELNTLECVTKLIESGITSFKIEGRMKSPAYVGYVTYLYRKLIDHYYQKQEVKLSPLEMKNLKMLFNREFTKGYLFQSDDIMNIQSPNHVGAPIGKVIQLDKKFISIRLEDDLSQGDGIRFQELGKGMMVNRLYNDKGLLTNFVKKGNVCLLDNKFGMKKKDTLLKTIDSKLITDIEIYVPKKIEVSVLGEFKNGEPFSITISDGVHTVKVLGEVVEKALKQEVTKVDMIRCIDKFGNTPFLCKNITINKDEFVFVHLKFINEVRRKAVLELVEQRTKIDRKIIIHDVLKEKKFTNNLSSKCKLNVLVRTREQLECCLKQKLDEIYVTDYNLYCQYKSLGNIFYRVDRVQRRKETFKNEKLLVGDFGSVFLYQKDNDLVGDYYLNITNSYSIDFLNQIGIRKITLSVELDKEKIRNIMKQDYPAEMIVYGRIELMIMKYCPLKKCLHYCSQCKTSKEQFCLEDMTSRRYPMIRENCITHIMHFENLDRISEIQDYQKMGIQNFRIEFFEENTLEVEEVISKVKKQLKYQ